MVDGAIDEATAVAAAPATKRARLKRKAGGISALRLLAFSSPTLPLVASLVPVAFLLPPFYTGELGMSLATWSLVLLVSRFFDVCVDPFVGMLCDRFPSRWGRRRHWIVLATPIVMIGATMLFMPKLFMAHPTPAFAIAATILSHFGYTVASLNSYAWSGELSDDYHERTRILGWRGVVFQFSPVLALVIPAILERLDPAATNGDKVASIGWLIVVLMPLSVALSLASVGERPRAAPAPTGEKQRLLAGLKILIGNRLLQRVLAVMVLQAAPLAMMMSINIFYVTFVLQAPGVGATLLLVPFLTSLISTPLWMRLAKGREKHKVLAVAYVLTAMIMSSFLWLGAGDVVAFAVIIFFSGACGGTLFLLQSILTDVVDTDLAESGE
ncbi:MAG: melB, partial [Phenylobacterium sp.]|nr:melB [Phenylobacterium sp.]